MSTVTIDNLSESEPLDQAASAELHGGMINPAMFSTFLASFDLTEVTQNAINVNFVTGDQGINSIGSLSIMPISAASAMTVIKGSL